MAQPLVQRVQVSEVRQGIGIALMIIGCFSGMFGLIGGFAMLAEEKYFLGALAIVIPLTIFSTGTWLALSSERNTSLTANGANAELDPIIRELSNNYRLLRWQALLAFIFAIIGMGLGLVMLGYSFFNVDPSSIQSIKNWQLYAGIISEVVSAFSTYMFKQTFERIGKTSEELLLTWKQNAALRLAAQMTGPTKDEIMGAVLKQMITK